VAGNGWFLARGAADTGLWKAVSRGWRGPWCANPAHPAARRRAYGAFASPRNPGLRADPAARIADSVPFSSAAAQLQKLTFRN
jgi:hypothetical protein